MDALQLKQQINELLKTGKYDCIKQLLLSHKNMTEKNNELAEICYLCTLYEQEKGEGQVGIFEKVSSVDGLLERYTALKFYLRRIEFDVVDGLDSFFLFLAQNQVSSYEMMKAIEFSTVHKEKVLGVINGSVALHAAASEESAYDREECRVSAADALCDACGLEAGSQEKNGKEICFIICTNNPIFAGECIYYINHLLVPPGYEIDILTVEDAKSMTSGYNEAMQHSKAKYKIYLHHDTFIVNPHFIENMLHIFQSHPDVGMLGVIGAPHIPENGIMWDDKRYGMVYEQHIYETVMLSNPCNQPLEEVEAIDGLLMATQYDIPWREDLFDKWDFYDCSQSMEFIRHGYKVAVPKTEKPWCLHDCGFLNLENYDTERKKFISEYLC